MEQKCRVRDTFTSPIRWEDRTDKTIYVGCSYGGCAPHHESFLTWRGRPLADRILLPGAVRAFIEIPDNYKLLRKLSDEHKVDLFLVSFHPNCALYVSDGKSQQEIFEEQVRDLGVWYQVVRLINPTAGIELYQQEPDIDLGVFFRPLYL